VSVVDLCLCTLGIFSIRIGTAGGIRVERERERKYIIFSVYNMLFIPTHHILKESKSYGYVLLFLFIFRVSLVVRLRSFALLYCTLCMDTNVLLVLVLVPESLEGGQAVCVQKIQVKREREREYIQE